MDGYTGIQHQCEGFGLASINFNLENLGEYNGPKSASAFISFGESSADDSYAKPKVMACCSPAFDEGVTMQDQPHYKSCFHDFAENGCLTLWAELNQKAADTPLGQGKYQIQSIADWLADNQQACYEQFWVASGASQFEPVDDLDFFTVEHTWALPTSAETLWIKDIELEIDLGYIHDVHLPANPADWLRCESQQDNNDVVPVAADMSEGDVYTLSYGELSLLGPGTPPFEGFTEFTSLNTACSSCSTLSTEQTSTGVWLHGLVLDTADVAEVTDGTTTVDVDRARITLFAAKHATHIGGVDYKIPAGEAMFVVSAVVEGEPTMTTAVNATDIFIEDYIPMLLSPTYGWKMHPFEITYTDSNNDLWTLETSTMYFYP